MTTYRKLHGKAVKTVTTNPTDDTAEGQIWFNTTDNKFRSVVSLGSWSTTTNVPYSATAAGATGSQTANLVFSGYGPPPATPAGVLTTVEYNGLGWTSGGNMGDGRAYIGSAGTQTAGLAIGGLESTSPYRSAKTEEYDGSSWSEQNDLSNARGQGVGTGLQTAGMYTTGDANPPDYSTYVENYDGTSWTNGTANSLGRRVSTGNGTQTSTIIIAGNINPSDTKTGLTEEWDGSSWSSGGTVNTARKGGMAAGASQDSSLFFGGTAAPGASTATEDYDGTSWTTSSATMGTAVTDNQQGGGGNVNTAALVCNGPNSNSLGVQEYNKSINTITPASWSSGGNYPTNIYGAAGAGNTPAGLVFGGYNGSAGVTTTSEYDGSSFSSGGALPVAKRYLAGFGTQTAALAAKGKVPPGPAVATSEEYDGSSWTAGGTASDATMSVVGSGTQTSGVVFGGNPSASNSTEEYNGSSWTSGGNLNTGRANHSSSVGGTQTAALAFFGQDGSTPLTLNVEAYDGSS